MLDILQIQKHATEVAARNGAIEECPYYEGSAHGLLWLDYFRAECQRLAGDLCGK